MEEEILNLYVLYIIFMYFPIESDDIRYWTNK